MVGDDVVLRVAAGQSELAGVCRDVRRRGIERGIGRNQRRGAVIIQNCDEARAIVDDDSLGVGQHDREDLVELLNRVGHDRDHDRLRLGSRSKRQCAGRRNEIGTRHRRA